MYLTPVIYAMSLLPGWLSKIVMINPVTNYLMMYRDVMLNGSCFTLTGFFLGLAEAAAALIIGLVLFAKKQDTFILNI